MATRSVSPALSDVGSEAGGVSLNVSNLKRKSSADADETPVTSKRAAKRAKKRANAPATAFDEIDVEKGVNPAIARMDAALLADHVARNTKRFEKDLSTVELEDKRVPVSAILDSSSWEGDRTMEQLPSFLEQTTKKSREELSHSTKAKGCPHTLVIAASGIRAADLTRTLRVFHTKQSTVAKLFAKHIKLKEAVESAKATRMNIGIGTPQRILDLIEKEAISLKSLSNIVVDASHVDQKKRGILDMRETLSPLLKFLTLPGLRSRYDGPEGTNTRILFY